MIGCFIGQEPEIDLEDIIYNKLRVVINYGVTEFYTARTNKFDMLCENAAIELEAKVQVVAENKIDKKWIEENCDVIVCCFYDYELEKAIFDGIEEKLIVNISL